MKTLRSALAWLLSLSLVLTPLAGVQAAMIDNTTLLSPEPVTHTRASLQQWLTHDVAREQLEAMGVSPEWAEQRVARLSDAELARINQGIGQLEAGSDSFLGFLAALFIILVITDALGFTDVFPFVH